MICLHCGDCCLRMSPLGSPCPKLIKHGNFYFCGDYENRPEDCKTHQFPFPVCAVGVEKLGIYNVEQLHMRIDTGYAMLKYDIDDPDEAYNVLVNDRRCVNAMAT